MASGAEQAAHCESSAAPAFRPICTMGTTKVPPRQGHSENYTRAWGASASSGSCGCWFCYQLRSQWSRPLRNRLGVGSRRQQGAEDSAGPSLPVPKRGSSRSSTLWAPGTGREGSLDQF